MIRDHKWRPTHVSSSHRTEAANAKRRRCGYLNCGRPRGEHASSVTGYETAAVRQP